MGWFRHHAIVATSCRERAFDGLMDLVDGRGLGTVSREGVNGYTSFFLAPDGSKEGWPASVEGNALRQEVIAWLVEKGYDWAEVRFGADEPELFPAKVLQSNG